MCGEKRTGVTGVWGENGAGVTGVWSELHWEDWCVGRKGTGVPDVWKRGL